MIIPQYQTLMWKYLIQIQQLVRSLVRWNFQVTDCGEQKTRITNIVFMGREQVQVWVYFLTSMVVFGSTLKKVVEQNLKL